MSSAERRHSVLKAAVRILLLVLGAPDGVVVAQSHLLGASTTTRVKSISFTFEDVQVEPESVLKELIATRAPRLKDRLPGLLQRDRDAFRLDPIELQRDVVRLRTHLQSIGFLHARVDYAASRYDLGKDEIRVRFTIRHGPPVIIQDVGFYTNGGYLASAFEGEVRARWISFRDRTSFRTGDRYTTLGAVQIEDEVLGWLYDQSYAFATLDTQVEIDTVHSTADISFFVDPGPAGIIAQVDVEGTRRVSTRLVERALPFKVGDAFANRHLVKGQRALFELNLFQIARVHVPPQERDSTVTVRVDRREARQRYLSAETGYEQRHGLLGRGRWSHRNFMGGARIFTVTVELQTGVLASKAALLHRLGRASVALTQPNIFADNLTAVIEPFVQIEKDPLLLDTSLPFGINRREYGASGTLIYGRLTTRVFSLQYSMARAAAFSDGSAVETRDAYSKGIVTLSGLLGWTDNLLNPRRGYSIQSFVEQGGALEHLLGQQGLEYAKVSVEASGFIPLTQDLFIGMRMAGGHLWPGHADAEILYRDSIGAAKDPQFFSPMENRFDPVRFYVGGEDVRGWSSGLVGPKEVRGALVRDEDGAVVYVGDEPQTSIARYEPVGGLVRASAGVELWYRLGGPWRVAVFLDAGQVSSRSVEEPGCTRLAFRDAMATQPVVVQCGFSDTGRLAWGGFKLGTGIGMRYETPIGFVSVDLAVKVNPDALDLQTPRNAFLVSRGLAEAERSQLSRLGVHVSIGQVF